MDAAALRQAYSAVPVVPVRADIYARRDAVSTELPVSQSVASTGDAAVQNDVSRNAPKTYGASGIMTGQARTSARPIALSRSL